MRHGRQYKTSNAKNSPVQKLELSSKNSIVSLHEQALTSLPKFADLIGFHGGWSFFGECHDELSEFITHPQNNLEAIQNWTHDKNEEPLGLRRLLLMPRGHLKTSVATVLYTLWRIYRNPNIRILVGSNVQNLSFSFIRELRTYLENDALQDNVWNQRPHIKGDLIPRINVRTQARNFNGDTEARDRKVIWNNAALQVNRNSVFKEPTVYAASVGASVTGQHFDLIILDDLHDKTNTVSETKRKAVFDWIEDAESVINPACWYPVEGLPLGGEILGGEVIFTGTRYHVDDYYGLIIDNQEEMEYRVHSRNIFKNGNDNSDGYLWHERYDDAAFNRIKARMSDTRFSSQYLNRVYEKDFGVFSWDMVGCVNREYIYRSGYFMNYREENTGLTTQLVPIIAIDPAFSSNKKGDDCAVLVASKLKDGRLLVLDGFVERIEAATLVKRVQELADKYLAYRVYYEENGVGMLLPELLKQKTPEGKALICYGHYEQRNKEAKIQGVLELAINSGQILLSDHLHQLDKLQKQISRFPSVAHDDFLDCLVTALEKTPGIRSKKSQHMAQPSTFTSNLYLNTVTPEKQRGIHEYLPSY